MTYEELFTAFRDILKLREAWHLYKVGSLKCKQAAMHLAKIFMSNRDSIPIPNFGSDDIRLLCPFLSLSLSFVVAILYAVRARVAHATTRATIPTITSYLAKHDPVPSSESLICVWDLVQSRRRADGEFISCGSVRPLLQIRFDELFEGWTMTKTEEFTNMQTRCTHDDVRAFMVRFLSNLIRKLSRPIIEQISEELGVQYHNLETKVLFYIHLTPYQKYFPPSGVRSRAQRLFDQLQLPDNVLMCVHHFCHHPNDPFLSQITENLRVSPDDKDFFAHLEQTCHEAGIHLVVMHPPNIHKSLNLLVPK